jgi:hypothetical protein
MKSSFHVPLFYLDEATIVFLFLDHLNACSARAFAFRCAPNTLHYTQCKTQRGKRHCFLCGLVLPRVIVDLQCDTSSFSCCWLEKVIHLNHFSPCETISLKLICFLLSLWRRFPNIILQCDLSW